MHTEALDAESVVRCLLTRSACKPLAADWVQQRLIQTGCEAAWICSEGSMPFQNMELAFELLQPL